MRFLSLLQRAASWKLVHINIPLHVKKFSHLRVNWSDICFLCQTKKQRKNLFQFRIIRFTKKWGNFQTVEWVIARLNFRILLKTFSYSDNSKNLHQEISHLSDFSLLRTVVLQTHHWEEDNNGLCERLLLQSLSFPRIQPLHLRTKHDNLIK